MPSSRSRPAGALRESMMVRASTGARRDDAWVETRLRPLRDRLRDAVLVAIGGTLVGVLLLPVPLIHLFGLFFAFGAWVLAVMRLRASLVVAAAGGTCPACGAAGEFYVGFGSRRVRFPLGTSCPACAIGLSLEPTR